MVQRVFLAAMLLGGLGGPATAEAKVVTKTVDYTAGDAELKGYLAFDDAVPGRRPGVLVVHEWWGLNDYAKRRAEQVAELGYVALAVDMYGGGKTTSNPKEAGTWAGEVRRDVNVWRQRIQAGFDKLAANERVDPRRIAAIGYCFGGSTALQLAYSEPKLAGAVSFHGSLVAPRKEDFERIKASILILHGADDKFVPPEEMGGFQKSMNEAEADWHMVIYAHAVHSFTNPHADAAGMAGVAYNQKADERSWRHMHLFFRELFGELKEKSGEPSK